MPEERRSELSPNALRVLEARYLRRDAERRVVETPDDLFRRVARLAIAAGLRERAIAPGDRVALILRTEEPFFASFVGALLTGACRSPSNTRR